MRSRIAPNFAYPRKRLKNARELHDSVEEFIKKERVFQRHEKKHPGRMQRFLEEAWKDLAQAEELASLIPEDEKNFQGHFARVGRYAFDNALKLAVLHMQMAVLDVRIMQGEEYAARQSRSNKARTIDEVKQAIDDYIVKLSQREGEGPAGLWMPFFGELDAMGLSPRILEDAIEFDHPTSPMNRDTFRKKIQRAREKD